MFYAAGGGGGTASTAIPGEGGSNGVGGIGGNTSIGAGAGQAGTGSGGGGGVSAGTGGAGGSGIVIVAYVPQICTDITTVTHGYGDTPNYALVTPAGASFPTFCLLVHRRLHSNLIPHNKDLWNISNIYWMVGT